MEHKFSTEENTHMQYTRDHKIMAKQNSSKPINMGSSFEHLNRRNINVKTVAISTHGSRDISFRETYLQKSSQKTNSSFIVAREIPTKPPGYSKWRTYIAPHINTGGDFG